MAISIKDTASELGINPVEKKDGGVSIGDIAQGIGIKPQAGDRTAGTIAEEAIKSKGFTEDIVGDVKEFGSGIFTSIRERAGAVKGIFGRGETGQVVNPVETAILTVGEVAGAVGDIIGEGFLGLGKLLASEEVEQETKQGFINLLEKTGATQALQKGYEGWQEFKAQNPRKAELVEAGANIADAFLEATGIGVVKKTVRKGIETVVETGLRTSDDIFRTGKEKLFGKEIIESEIKDVDSLVRKADELLETKPVETAGELLRVAEETAPPVTLIEKFAGIRPDIKKRIAGKQGKLKTYFDIAHASNLDDTLPTVYDFANLQVKKAERALRDQLDDVGSKIGQTRSKLATTRVAIDQVDNIIRIFDDELAKLNLTTDARGSIIQQTGKAKAVGAGEIRVLNELRDNLGKIKQNPTIDNVIDNRFIFDDRINFAKRSGDVSGVIDPISRKIRASLADLNANTVGKTNAKDLKDYSIAKEAQKQLEGFTTRKAGSEYLLRLVLSGRGREARESLDLIKQITGLDLLDDATMLQIAVELIGNARTKNLFRQEIEKAGLDVAKVLSGKGGAISTLFEKAKDKLIDEEKIFLEASK